MIPKFVFFTKGVGTNKDKLASFEQALRMGGIEKYNLVNVSSILPPGCKIISKAEGIKLMQPGQISFVVMARESTDRAWDERKDEYRASGKIIKTRVTCQSAEVKKGGQWTTVIAAAVFIIE